MDNDRRAAARLDAHWEASNGTAAGRAAACSLAISTLPESMHAPWGPRAALCFMDVSAPGSPLLPDPERSAGAERSNLAGNLAWSLLELLCERASPEALASCFAALPAPDANGATDTPGKMAASLFRECVGRFCKAGLHAELAAMAAGGGRLGRHDIPALLADGAQALRQPALAQACLEGLRSEFAEAAAKDGALAARLHPLCFVTCPSPVWRKLLLDSFAIGDPDRLELENLICLRGTCQRAASMGEAQVAELNKRHLARGRRPSQIKALPQAERDAASKMSAAIAERWRERLALLARLRPHAAARILMERPDDPRASHSAWAAIGLESVEAEGFLADPHEMPRAAGSWQSPARCERLWPTRLAAGSLSGLRLSHLDCMMLSGCSREAIEAQAALGSRSAGQLVEVLDGAWLRGRIPERDALWMCSFAARPDPAPSKGPLRV